MLKGINSMDDFRDAVYQFTAGFIISVFGNITWILQVHIYSPSQVAFEWFLKVVGTMIMGIIGGMAALFSKDLYKWIKKKVLAFTEKLYQLMEKTSYRWSNFWKKTPVWAKRMGNGLMAVSITGGGYALASNSQKIALVLFGCAIVGKFLTEFFADEPAPPQS